MVEFETNSSKLRVIKTARRLNDINAAVKEGFKPLIQWIKPSEKIYARLSVIQHKKTKEVDTIVDERTWPDLAQNGWKTVINFSFYYPHVHEHPFAAYLLPKDLKKGEQVFLEDLIEDIPYIYWSQYHTYRLGSCKAIWNGENFEIQFNPDKHWRIIN